MDADGLQGEVVNLGSDDEITILDLAEVILDLCDTPSEITHDPLPEDDPARRRSGPFKGSREPNVSLREGLERTLSQFEA